MPKNYWQIYTSFKISIDNKINKKKIHVRGFDIDQKKINFLKRNISTNSDVKNSELARIKNKNFFNIKKNL